MIDDFDRKLLRAVQTDAGLTNDILAERLSMSVSAVQRRLKRLRETEVILADISLVDPKAVGCQLLFVVGLEVERKRSDLYLNLQRWISRNEEVQQAYNVTGSSDFILVVTAISLEAYDTFMTRMVEANTNITKFTTSVVLQTFKRGLFTPV
ncbi:MAG TPA: Lrp/AsnC family transcriptional regulator [Usitatibacter sp.]|jgi:DNA-binding Lrp family transcriptional regulator|nr:Lrp/AsnC family transcriptional regulator [Usitatibacter sp.]